MDGLTDRRTDRWVDRWVDVIVEERESIMYYSPGQSYADFIDFAFRPVLFEDLKLTGDLAKAAEICGDIENCQHDDLASMDEEFALVTKEETEKFEELVSMRGY